MNTNNAAKLDYALLTLRIGIGIMFFFHGYPKMIGGIEKWQSLGAYGMGTIGIHFFPTFWGFMAAFSECIGGLMIAFGIYTQYFSFLLFVTMLIASATHLIGGDGLMGASHAIEATFIFIFLCLVGSGKFSLKK